jgi:hypothetical protein
MSRYSRFLRRITTADNLWLYEITGYPSAPVTTGGHR